MAAPSSKSATLGTLFVLLSAVLFALKAILIKFAYHADSQLTGIQLLALRMGSALPFFIAITLLSQRSTHVKTSKDWGLLFLAGFMGYYLASILDFIGLETISASLERIILFLYPTLTVLLMAILKGQRIKTRTIIALILSYAGTLLVMVGEGVAVLQQKGMLTGSAFVFASAVAYALYLVMTPNLIQRFGSWRFTGLAMSLACIAALIHFFVITSNPLVWLHGLSWTVIGYGVALGFFSTVLPTTLLMQGIERIGSSQAAMISSGGPVLTVFIAVLALNEHLNALQWLGCALNIGGVLMITLTPKPKAPDSLVT